MWYSLINKRIPGKVSHVRFTITYRYNLSDIYEKSMN